MKILILTGKFGMGHYSASSSLREQIQASFPDSVIETKDIFEYTVPTCSGAIYKTFSLFVNRGRGIYNKIYQLTENSKTDLRPVFLSYFLYKLHLLVQETQPDLIISTLPFCSQLVSRYKSKYQSALSLITCITDISSHSEWINENTNCYLVGSESLKQRLICKGVCAEKIHINGIPVKDAFKKRFPATSTTKRKLLVMGGGLGLLPKSKLFYQQLNALNNVSTTIITGNNKHLYRMLYEKYDNITVLGYTDEVYKYMLDADVVLSKPGGITLFESISSETPLLVFAPFLQQEINNTSFILSKHIGKVIDSSSALCLCQIQAVLCDTILLEELRANLIKLKSEFDTTTVEKVVFSYQPKRREVYA